MGCIASTDSLYMEHNLFQAGSGEYEAKEHVLTESTAPVDLNKLLISSYLHPCSLDHNQILHVVQISISGFLRKKTGYESLE